MVGINNNLKNNNNKTENNNNYNINISLSLPPFTPYQNRKKMNQNSTATAISSQPTTEGHAPSGYVPLRLCPAGGARPPSAGGQAGTRWGMS